MAGSSDIKNPRMPRGEARKLREEERAVPPGALGWRLGGNQNSLTWVHEQEDRDRSRSRSRENKKIMEKLALDAAAAKTIGAAVADAAAGGEGEAPAAF